MSSPAEALALVRTLSEAPRAAGSSAEGRARELAAGVLREAGFVVAEEPFTYSALVGAWGTVIAGVASIAGLLRAASLGAAGRGGAALVLLSVTGLVGGVVGAWATRRGVLHAPVLRRRSVNLVATRGSGTPRVWLLAHLDSKSQPVPIGLRAAGIVATALAWVGALSLAAAQALAPDAVPFASGLWPWIGGVGAVAGLPVAASLVLDGSPGALDNATGVATVLLGASATRDLDAPVGVVLTSAEELGLAGARAWASGRHAAGDAPGIALNVDSIDDAGMLTVMAGRRAPHATAALATGAAQAGAAHRVRRLIPGILVDAVALEARGWDVATLSRGTWGTLARIHTRRDVASRLDGRGVAEAARVLALAVRALATSR